MTKIFIGSDHAGFELKTGLKEHLALEHLVSDCGTDSVEKTDYPVFAKAVCSEVLQDPESIGILICSSGIGMSIAANRFSGIRAALCRTVKDIKLGRQHNNANVLVLGASNVSEDEALNMVHTFISTPFHGGRHARRIEQIEQ